MQAAAPPACRPILPVTPELDQAGERFNFAHRADELEAGGLILPKDAPEWAGDAARVWREAEHAEQTLDRQTGEWRWKKNGQVAKHMTVALPREATAEQRQAMLMEFVHQTRSSRSCMASSSSGRFIATTTTRMRIC